MTTLTIRSQLPAEALYGLLREERRAEIGGYVFGLDPDNLLWITSPYGIDVAFLDFTIENCGRWIEAIGNEAEEREGGAVA
ncbi:hypothetical protein QOZ96_003371 [Brevundimonas nasdae]|uniref:hypothetical protein n=1 Tax=Brevundimonas nasdae TaxID=172043 RepID=UPI001914286A|nr:hypothetical protein [Brevundimonas nasdae]MBK6026792.1 hypothetical protein [Brevundimonas nasdae]MDQ0453401.1 hypothetical protein [Brevundimonas nasdae]